MTDAVRDTFVGRERELSELSAGVDDTGRGLGRVFLISGEPGIGKTRLAGEAAGVAAARGFRVVWGRCREGGGAPPFWPWLQILRACPREAEGTAAAADPAADLARLLPDSAPPGDATASNTAPPGRPSAPASEETRFALFDAVAAWIGRLALAQPLALVFDDLHTADRPSLLLLEFVAQALPQAALLIVGTYRDAEARADPALAASLAEIARRGHVLPLRGLPTDDVGRFVATATGIAPSPAFVALAHDKTTGNPLFLDGVVRLLRAEGRLDEIAGPPAGDLGVPDAVRESIRGRVARLPDAARQVLPLAAVLGRRFAQTPLRLIADLPDAALLAALSAARDAGLLVESAAAPGAYSFTHELIREALYEDLPLPRRAALHQRAGEALAALPAGTATATEIAHHFHRALPAGDADAALAYSSRAAEEAMRQLAYEEAAGHLERALQAADAAGRPERRATLLLALGEALRLAGELPRAREHFLAAIELAAVAGAPDVAGRAALGFAGRWFGAAGVDEATVAVLRGALTRLGGDDHRALRATVMGRLAIELYFQSLSRAESERLADEAVATARRAGEPAALAYALHARHVAFWGPVHDEDRMAVGSEIGALGEQAGNAELVLWGRLWRLLACLEQGHIAAFDAELEAMAQQAQRLRLPSFQWWMRIFAATRAHLDGRFADSDRIAQDAMAFGQRIAEPNAAQYGGIQLLSLSWDRGRLAEIEAPVEALSVQYPAVHSWRAVRALAAAHAGGEDRARLALDGLLSEGVARVPRDAGWLPTMAALAEVCHWLEDADGAAALYAELAPCAGRLVVAGTAITVRGAVSHYLGLLAATMVRWDDAERHLRDALALHCRLQARPFIAHSRVELAAVLLARGAPRDRARAASALALGLTAARQIGMERLAARALMLREQLGTADRLDASAGEPASAARVAGARHAVDNVVAVGSPRRARRTAAGAPPALHAAPAEASHDVFRKEGDYWSLSFDGRVARLKDAKGLHYLACLLRRPGEELHALELVSEADPDAGGATNGQPRPTGDAGEILDARARADYRRRLADLAEEIGEARRCHDLGRVALLQSELDFLARELSAGTGLGGRPRRAGSPSERARINVTRRIARTVKHIGETDPAFARYLDTTVRTGTFCAYLPDPRFVVRWQW